MTDVLDMDRGIAACAGNRRLHAQTVAMLAADLRGRIDGLLQAVSAGDLPTAGRLAHKHKGACLAVGAHELADIFGAIDEAARTESAAEVQERSAQLAKAAAAFRCAAIGLQ